MVALDERERRGGRWFVAAGRELALSSRLNLGEECGGRGDFVATDRRELTLTGCLHFDEGMPVELFIGEERGGNGRNTAETVL